MFEDGRKAYVELSAELRKAQEALSVANLAIGRQRKTGETKAIPSSQKEAQLQKEVDKCMVGTECDTVTNRACLDLSFTEHPQVFNV